MKSVLVVHPEQCLACRACELACAVEHSESKCLTEAIRETPSPKNRVWVAKGEAFVTPLQCRHCENAPCAEICPTNAIFRQNQESPVELDHERCIGCRWCVLACPFGVIRIDSGTGAVLKCDMCAERLAAGEKPACVAACHTGALELADVDELVREKSAAFLLRIERSAEAEVDKS